MYTSFAHAFAYAITKTPYAFFAKITLCMYLLYDISKQNELNHITTTLKCNGCSDKIKSPNKS